VRWWGRGVIPCGCGSRRRWVYFILSIPGGEFTARLGHPVHQPRFRAHRSGCLWAGAVVLVWVLGSWFGHGDGRVPPHSRRRPLLSVRCWCTVLVTVESSADPGPRDRVARTPASAPGVERLPGPARPSGHRGHSRPSGHTRRCRSTATTPLRDDRAEVVLHSVDQQLG